MVRYLYQIGERGKETYKESDVKISKKKTSFARMKSCIIRIYELLHRDLRRRKRFISLCYYCKNKTGKLRILK